MHLTLCLYKFEGKNMANIKILEETYYLLCWVLTKLGSIYSKTKAFIANVNKLQNLPSEVDLMHRITANLSKV